MCSTYVCMKSFTFVCVKIFFMATILGKHHKKAWEVPNVFNEWKLLLSLLPFWKRKRSHISQHIWRHTVLISAPVSRSYLATLAVFIFQRCSRFCLWDRSAALFISVAKPKHSFLWLNLDNNNCLKFTIIKTNNMWRVGKKSQELWISELF